MFRKHVSITEETFISNIFSHKKRIQDFNSSEVLEMGELNPETRKQLCNAQKDEIKSYQIYKKLSKTIKNPHNSEILMRIANEEKKHYEFLQTLTERNFKPSKFKIWFYFIILRIFGLTFGIRLMERGEGDAQLLYSSVSSSVPNLESILAEEASHENELINMLDEERLNYIGSVVLGLSDALVELTGVLAGLTLALNNSQLIALIGLITGISASFSMGASEYLSTSEEEQDKQDKSPLKASIYTGITYLFTVLLLVFPFLIVKPINALGLTLIVAVVIIFIFTYYVSVAKSLPFKRRFFKISAISLGVAFISLLIGIVIKAAFNIDL